MNHERDVVGTHGCAVIFFGCIGAWITHIYICIETGRWVFLIFGALYFPVGIVHGAGHWYELW